MSAAKFLRFWLPVLLWTAFIFWLSSAPRKAPPLLRFPGADKIIHLIEYTPLGFLLMRAAVHTWAGFQFAKQRGTVLAMGAFVGVADEFLQSFVPTRQMSVWDFAADVTAVLLGLLLYRWIRSARTP